MRVHTLAAHIAVDEGERIHALVTLDLLRPEQHTHGVAARFDAPRAGQADDRIAPPFLAALHGLEQETARARKAQVRAEWCVEIGQQTAQQRNARVALQRQRPERGNRHARAPRGAGERRLMRTQRPGRVADASPR